MEGKKVIEGIAGGVLFGLTAGLGWIIAGRIAKRFDKGGEETSSFVGPGTGVTRHLKNVQCKTDKGTACVSPEDCDRAHGIAVAKC